MLGGPAFMFDAEQVGFRASVMGQVSGAREYGQDDLYYLSDDVCGAV